MYIYTDIPKSLIIAWNEWRDKNYRAQTHLWKFDEINGVSICSECTAISSYSSMNPVCHLKTCSGYAEHTGFPFHSRSGQLKFLLLGRI